MSLRIHTNLASIAVGRQLEAASLRLGASTARLSSGLRISVAADDASGLGISERLRARVRSLNVAARNAQDGQSFLQAAEGGLDEVSNILGRMRELAVQAASGTLSTDQRTTLNVEFQGLKNEIDRIAKLEFNGIRVLNNTTLHHFQVGADSRDVISIGNVDTRTVTLGLASNGVGTTNNASNSITKLDDAIERVSNYRGSRGAAIQRLEAARSSAQTASLNLSSAESRIRDVDVARETSILTRDTILQQAAISVLAQANASPSRALQLLRFPG